MYPRGRAGLSNLEAGASFAPVTERVIGNAVPGWTGSPGDTHQRPGPHPLSQPMGGNVGNYDGLSGPDPRSPGGQLPANPRVVREGVEQDYNGPPTRVGIKGFNDQLQVRDRHVYWDRGHQRTGISPSVPGNPPNNHSDGPARPDLRAVNISINPQIGSDNTANQDDLTRPYSPYGQQDGTAQPIYGGVPGLYVPYGSRGGVPFPVADPTSGDGGPEMVYSGPPHGLHSDTLPDGKQIADRYKVTPQMRPVRFDRPDNSRIAGQSFSQTVQSQAATGSGAGAGAAGSRAMPGAGLGLSFHIGTGSRGWGGR